MSETLSDLNPNQQPVIEDPYFLVKPLAKTPMPQQVVYQALHQDYLEDPVYLKPGDIPSDQAECGRRSIKALLDSKRGHFGPLEHPAITFNCGNFPHSVMQQATRHRLLTFDVASFRYTGQRIVDVATGERDVEQVFYLRPAGNYTDRQGKKYTYTEAQRQSDLLYAQSNAERYAQKIDEGFSEEHARSQVLFDVRQHWVVSSNLRSLMHLLCVRGKADSQLEIQQMSRMMLPHFEVWAPELYYWFEKNLWTKGLLAA